MGWVHARRAPEAPHGPHSPEPAPGDQPGPQSGSTDATVPAWLAYLRSRTAELDRITGYEPGTDQQRAAACPRDRDVLARLAELSEQTSPYQATLTLFGGDR
jgi:hypothetical protein